MTGQSNFRAFKRRVKDALVRLSMRKLGVHLGEFNQPLPLIDYLDETCTGVIHVGANLGQEYDSYRNAGLASVVYIEPIPDVFAALKKRVSADPRHHPIQALCSDKAGVEVDFHIASNRGESSSMLELGSSKQEHPDVHYVSKLRLTTTTLDDIIFNTPGIEREKLDTLVMDVQGAEMKVIGGAARTLQQCHFVFLEITEGGFYLGDSPFEELIAALKTYGFALKAMGINKHHWGNAFLMRERH